jgi:hypothetical protein
MRSRFPQSAAALDTFQKESLPKRIRQFSYDRQAAADKHDRFLRDAKRAAFDLEASRNNPSRLADEPVQTPWRHYYALPATALRRSKVVTRTTPVAWERVTTRLARHPNGAVFAV